MTSATISFSLSAADEQLKEIVANRTERDDSWLQHPALLRRYSAGDCHFLAVALHRRSGWQLRSCVDRSGRADLHAFVVTPSHLGLDVFGLHEINSMVSRWNAFGHMVVEPSTFDRWECYRGVRTRAVEEESRWLADEVAQAMLDKISRESIVV